MIGGALRSSWVEINLSNLDHNIKSIKKLVGEKTGIIGVIKADAYGCGAVKCSEVMAANGIHRFAVATLEEGIILRDSGRTEDIICLGLNLPDVDTYIVAYDLIAACDSSEYAEAISEEAVKQGKTARIILAVDTGMGRIGYDAADIEFAVCDIKKIEALPNLEIYGIFSHFSTADTDDKEYVEYQSGNYRRFCDALEDAGINIPMKTLANSAGTIDRPDDHYDCIRAGLIQYGFFPSEFMHQERLDIRPVMQVKAQIVKIKEIPAGSSVSYGRKFIAKRPSMIATANIGYADGLPRAYSPQAKVIVGGHFAPVAGNVCMDQFMIDITDVPGVKVGDEIIVMGSDGRLSITPDEIGEKSGTINDEILCAFGQRLPKVYVK